MISFSKLLLDQSFYGDTLRYHPQAHGARQGTRQGLGPIVVWNCTKACNLACRHCYASATTQAASGEMTTEEAKSFIDDLVDFSVPVLLFSGGEPLLRPDIFQLLAYGQERGLRMVISTNGTLIDGGVAAKIKALGVSYVGISLDGLKTINDDFRGKQGAFDLALQGLRHCRNAGQKTGLRLTLSKTTAQDLPAIFDLIEAEAVPRVCFYHLVYSGRGAAIVEDELSASEKRQVIDLIMDKTLDFARRGVATEILTVDNHCDGIYLYQRMKAENPERAAKILELLTLSGGNRSGVAIAAVDWMGDVYIDQFTRDIPLGNVRRQTFADIWQGDSHEFLQKLRHRQDFIVGRCATCHYLPQCNGNFRARALSTGDIWASDPACYLSDKEISG